MVGIGATSLPCRLLHESRNIFKYKGHFKTEDVNIRVARRPFEQRRRELKKMNFPGNVSVTQAAHDWLLLIERCVYISTAFSSLRRLLKARCGPCEVLSQKSHISSALEFSRCTGYITIFRFGALSKHSFVISSLFIIIIIIIIIIF